MGDIIIFVIIVVSIALNFIITYNKESKKNAQRQIGKKISEAIKPTELKSSVNRSSDNTKRVEKKVAKVVRQPSLIDRFEEGQAALFATESGIYDIQPDISELDMEEGISEFDKNTANLSGLFNSKNDFKKAVLYSTILERKF